MERLAQHEENMAYFLQSREGAVLLRQVNYNLLDRRYITGQFFAGNLTYSQTSKKPSKSINGGTDLWIYGKCGHCPLT
jgi:hypothetical protein